MKVDLIKIEVKKLFGYLTYNIDNLDVDLVTFVIGKNGMGKTTILNLIFNLGDQRFSIFRSVEFDNIKFKFRCGRLLKTVEFKKDSKGICKWRIITSDRKTSFQVLPFGFSDLMSDFEKVKLLEKETTEVKLLSCGRHWSVNGRGHLDEEEVLRQMKPFIDSKYSGDRVVNTDEINFLKSWNVSFISADRLTKTEDDELQVDAISNDMVKVLEQHVISASSFSKTFEHDILTKLLHVTAKEKITLTELKKKLKVINDLESKVQSYGLYPDSKQIELPRKPLNENNKKLVYSYLKDKEARLNPHKEFLILVELFEELMNKSLAEKYIRPDSKDGLKVVRTNKKREGLKLDQLSSGEQHLIIIAYKLIFETPDNSYVLIDEPEISMHLEWQRSFASMLEKISKARKSRFLCATHSPSIVGSRRNALRDIKHLSNGRIYASYRN